ncbi:hypothetical protein PLESTM_001900900 [Pleodorina starrii]|nr:hypothetical protein PLESTM_001900900 [Pleodorina starrii]
MGHSLRAAALAVTTTTTTSTVTGINRRAATTYRSRGGGALMIAATVLVVALLPLLLLMAPSARATEEPRFDLSAALGPRGPAGLGGAGGGSSPSSSSSSTVLSSSPSPVSGVGGFLSALLRGRASGGGATGRTGENDPVRQYDSMSDPQNNPAAAAFLASPSPGLGHASPAWPHMWTVSG